MSSRRLTWVAAQLMATAVVVGAGAVPAAATPTDPPPTPSRAEVDRARDAVAEATAEQTRLQARLDAAQARLDAAAAAAGLAAERYNAAKVTLAAADRTASRTAAAAKKAAGEAAAAQLRVNQLAATLYMQGDAREAMEFFLGLADTADLARRSAGIEAASDSRGRILDAADTAAARAAAARRAAAQAQLRQRSAALQARQAFTAAQTAERAVAAEATGLERQRDEAIAALARLRSTSVDLEQRRQAALAEAAARAGAESARSRVRVPGEDLASLPAADTASAAAAIAFARAQLGKPYVWAAEGPDSWDCSGLTMKAWSAGGRSLTHYTGSQWQETARVPLADLKPGDLVFFGTDAANIHHVGLYVGGGMMIEAPRTGLHVRYSPIYRSSLLPYGGRP